MGWGNNTQVSPAQLAAIQARSNAVVTTTWANRAAAIAAIAALTPASGWVFVSDAGSAGCLYWCNGTILIPEAPPLYKYAGPMLLIHSFLAANAATYSQSGNTVTITCAAHGLTAAAHNGASLYVPIGAVTTGVAPSGSPAGWFSNFTYIDANTFSVTATNSQTGAGLVNSNTAITEFTPANFTIPGGILGVAGKLRCSAIFGGDTTAITKTARQSFGVSSVAGSQFTNSGYTSISSLVILSVRAGVSTQCVNQFNVVQFIDSTQNQIVSTTGQVSANNGWISLASFAIEVM